MKINSRTDVNQIRTLQLDGKGIILMLQEKGIIAHNETVKEVFVRVPGGGDWSNTNLDIEGDESVQIVLHSNPEFPLEVADNNSPYEVWKMLILDRYPSATFKDHTYEDEHASYCDATCNGIHVGHFEYQTQTGEVIG